MYGWCIKPLCREVMPGNYYIDSPRDGSEPQLSAVCFTDHAPIYNFNLIKSTVLHCLAYAPCHFAKGACPESFTFTHPGTW